MNLKNQLRRSELLTRVYRRVRDVVSGPGWGAFHHDPIYRGVMLELVEALPFTSFVETGTYRGYSTELIASRHPKLPVFTSEVYEPSYHLARRALRKYPNITADLGSSDKWIEALLRDKKPGDFPLFFLDAHWQQYWPLRAELAHIADSGLRSVIVIDDFEVPGQSQFEFDIDGGGEQIAGLKCNLDYIAPSLRPANTYHAIFPKYTRQDAFAGGTGLMRGHILLFQNAKNDYDRFLSRPFVQKHYFAYGLLQLAAPATAAG